MKKVEAIIRKTKFEEVKDALHEAGIDFFSYCDVRGNGSDREGRIYRGVMYDLSSIERRLLAIVVRDENVDRTVEAVMRAAHTGEIGDGKIFVSSIEQSYRIRTGATGDASLKVSKDEKAQAEKAVEFTKNA